MEAGLQPEQAGAIIAVVIPYYNAAATLDKCLQSVFASRFQQFECIVVDDGSTDASAEIAARYPVRQLRTPGRSGPGVARNLGATEATTPLILFIDADVCLHADALTRVIDLFRDEPELTAVIGSYDNSPGDPGFLSQYRNLLHAFYHSTGKREASTFWGGCGAIRRDAFLAAGGFSDYYGRPSIEDIELGYRLKRDGHKLMLDPSIRVKHLKRWTLWGMIRTDVFDRGIPWTELILRHKRMPDDLNIQKTQRLSVTLVCLVALAGAIALFTHRQRLLIPVAAILVAIMNTYWIEQASRRLDVRLLLTLGLAAVGLTLANAHPASTFVIALAATSYLLLVLRYTHAYDDHQLRRATGILYGAVLAVSLFLMLREVPLSPIVGSMAAALVAVLLLNWRLYQFLGRHWGRAYALAAIPFHLLYYVYCAIAFIAGVALFFWNTRLRPRPDSTP
jgi:cellulose synthase/poly-beta-1,6-N-acetylglucosamine synthase-like glycosyltransferase